MELCVQHFSLVGERNSWVFCVYRYYRQQLRKLFSIKNEPTDQVKDWPARRFCKGRWAFLLVHRRMWRCGLAVAAAQRFRKPARPCAVPWSCSE